MSDELKTLKDFNLTETNGWGQRFIQEKELRQEAIKRIKSHEVERFKAFEKEHWGFESFHKGKIFELIEFFNITEEDLK